MFDLFEGAGYFIIPIGLCSVLAIFIVVERLVALRRSAIVPRDIQRRFVEGDFELEGDYDSVAGRIIHFAHRTDADSDQLKAFARLEISRMERGLFILEIVISAAPLIGLLGTVTGLVQVFGAIDPTSGMPDPSTFVEGVALALTTTMLGLAVAIPAIVFNSYLNRRIDSFAAQINVGVERLVALRRRRAQAQDQSTSFESSSVRS